MQDPDVELKLSPLLSRPESDCFLAWEGGEMVPPFDSIVGMEDLVGVVGSITHCLFGFQWVGYKTPCGWGPPPRCSVCPPGYLQL